MILRFKMKDGKPGKLAPLVKQGKGEKHMSSSPVLPWCSPTLEAVKGDVDCANLYYTLLPAVEMYQRVEIISIGY